MANDVEHVVDIFFGGWVVQRMTWGGGDDSILGEVTRTAHSGDWAI